MKVLKVGIAGYGIVGKRRHHFIDLNPNLKVVSVCDKTFKNNFEVINGINQHKTVEKLLEEDLDILFVCLTNDVAASVTIKGLNKGFHIFCEKPPGRNVNDIEKVIEAELKQTNLKLKYGFNHRYHDSVIEAMKLIKSGDLGQIINLRGVYGKSRIIPFSGGWRSKREIAGGGILLDQGIHMLDLMLLFCGEFSEIKSFISNDFWKHDVEDNAYVILKTKDGVVAMLNSTATQWEHKFNLDISLSKGFISLTGILSGSKSYGEEKIIYGYRKEESNNGQMNSKTIKYLDDSSWKREIDEFAEVIINNKDVESGSSAQALIAMKLVFNIYKADKSWL